MHVCVCTGNYLPLCLAVHIDHREQFLASQSHCLYRFIVSSLGDECYYLENGFDGFLFSAKPSVIRANTLGRIQRNTYTYTHITRTHTSHITRTHTSHVHTHITRTHTSWTWKRQSWGHIVDSLVSFDSAMA